MGFERVGPKKANHPSVGEKCPACGSRFVVGDFTCLIPLGPGDNAERQAKRDAGKPYAAVAVEVHWDCAAHS